MNAFHVWLLGQGYPIFSVWLKTSVMWVETLTHGPHMSFSVISFFLLYSAQLVLRHHLLYFRPDGLAHTSAATAARHHLPVAAYSVRPLALAPPPRCRRRLLRVGVHTSRYCTLLPPALAPPSSARATTVPPPGCTCSPPHPPAPLTAPLLAPPPSRTQPRL